MNKLMGSISTKRMINRLQDGVRLVLLFSTMGICWAETKEEEATDIDRLALNEPHAKNHVDRAQINALEKDIREEEWKWLLSDANSERTNDSPGRAVLSNVEHFFGKRDNLQFLFLPALVMGELQLIRNAGQPNLNVLAGLSEKQQSLSYCARIAPIGSLTTPAVWCSLTYRALNDFEVVGNGVTPDFDAAPLPIDPAKFSIVRQGDVLKIESPLQNLSRSYSLAVAKDAPFPGDADFYLKALSNWLHRLDKGKVTSFVANGNGVAYVGLNGDRVIVRQSSEDANKIEMLRFRAWEQEAVATEIVRNGKTNGGIETVQRKRFLLTRVTLSLNEEKTGVRLMQIMAKKADGTLSHHLVVTESHAHGEKAAELSAKYLDKLYEHWKDPQGFQSDNNAKILLNLFEEAMESEEDDLVRFFMVGHHLHLLLLAEDGQKFLKYSQSLQDLCNRNGFYLLPETFFLSAYKYADSLELQEIGDICFEMWKQCLQNRHFSQSELQHYKEELNMPHSKRFYDSMRALEGTPVASDK